MTSQNDNGYDSSELELGRARSDISNYVTTKQVRAPGTSSARDKHISLQTGNTILKSCLAPVTKKHVRFAPEVQQKLIADDDQISLNSSSNISNVSYIDTPKPFEYSDLVLKNSHHQPLSQLYQGNAAGSEENHVPESRHYSQIPRKGQSRTTTSSISRSASGINPPSKHATCEKVKYSEFYPDPVVIPWPNILDDSGLKNQVTARLLSRQRENDSEISRGTGRTSPSKR